MAGGGLQRLAWFRSAGRALRQPACFAEWEQPQEQRARTASTHSSTSSEDSDAESDMRAFSTAARPARPSASSPPRTGPSATLGERGAPSSFAAQPSRAAAGRSAGSCGGGGEGAVARPPASCSAHRGVELESAERQQLL